MSFSLDLDLLKCRNTFMFFQGKSLALMADSRADDNVVAGLSRTYLKIPCVCPCLTHTHLWSESRCGLIHEPGWPCVIEFHRGERQGVSWVPGSFPGGYAAWTPTHYRYPYVSEMNSPSDTRGLGLHLGSTDNATLISTVVYIVWPNCAPSELLPPTLLPEAESYGKDGAVCDDAFAGLVLEWRWRWRKTGPLQLKFGN